jgi:ABC-type glycerol-3-phosphate transport system substrate-binding protein
MPRRRAALLACALALAACGGSDGTTQTAATDDELDFVAPDVRGGQVVGADFAGQAMVIWFWAPW